MKNTFEKHEFFKPKNQQPSRIELLVKDETSCSAIGGNFSRILRSSHAGIYALLILMMSMFVFSCDQEPIVDESHSTELETFNNPSDVLQNLNINDVNSNFVSLSIDTLDVVRGINSRRSTCDVDVSITKMGGNSTKYDVLIYSEGDSTVYFDDIVEPGTYGSKSKTVSDIDDTKSYDIKITPDGSSTSEWFSFRITTPSLAYTYTFDLDRTPPAEKGEIDGFDHFDCP